MELEDVRSDLQALRRLYGLLESNPDNKPIPKADSLLDQRAQVLLKRLLDSGTDRLLETHSKIIAAAQLGASNRSVYSQSMLSMSPSFGRGSKKDIKYSSVWTSNDNRTLNEQKLSSGLRELSGMIPSSNGSDIRKKRCRLSEESNKTHQNSDKNASGGSSKASNQTRSHQLQRNESNVSSVLKSPQTTQNLVKQELRSADKGSNDLAEEVALAIQTRRHQLQRNESNASSVLKSPETKQNIVKQELKMTDKGSNDLSEEVAHAIRRIETQISALQLFTDRASTENRTLNSWSSRISGSDYVPDQTQLNSAVHLSQYLPRKIAGSDRNDFQTFTSNLRSNFQLRPQMEQDPNVLQFSASSSVQTSRGQKKAVEKAEHFSRAASQNSRGSYVNGLRIPQIHDNLAMSLQPVPVEPPPRRKEVYFSPLPPRPVIRPTLLDQEYQSRYENSRDTKIRRMQVAMGSQNVLQYRQEPDEEFTTSSYTTSVSPSSSSSWTSQQSSVGESETEASPDQSQDYQSIGSLSGSDADIEHSESSGESNSSYSRSVFSRRAKRSVESNPNSKKKLMGKFRRFKSKLGLIFHHHHHHHHHHHNDNGDGGSEDSKDGSGKPAWKVLNKILKRKNKRENGAADRLKKHNGGASKSVVRHQQHQSGGHFHGLVEGLMRHVRHSKKPKGRPGMGTGEPETNRHGKVVKKPQLWQIVRRHGGVRLPNRGRVKLGHARKRT